MLKIFEIQHKLEETRGMTNEEKCREMGIRKPVLKDKAKKS